MHVALRSTILLFREVTNQNHVKSRRPRLIRIRFDNKIIRIKRSPDNPKLFIKNYCIQEIICTFSFMRVKQNSALTESGLTKVYYSFQKLSGVTKCHV